MIIGSLNFIGKVEKCGNSYHIRIDKRDIDTKKMLPLNKDLFIRIEDVKQEHDQKIKKEAKMF